MRKIYPDVPAVFSNTGLEYPEIQKFVKGYDNVDIVTPDMRFDEVIKTYGYPLIGKEVAEAIHYARRIRGPERESTSGKNFAVKESRVVGKQTEWKRLECRGGRKYTSSRRVQRETDGQSSADGCPEPG